MDVIISISDDVAMKLGERAAITAQTMPAYAARVLAESVTKPTIDELLVSVRAEFARSGLTGEELLGLGRDALAAVRRSRGAKPR